MKTMTNTDCNEMGLKLADLLLDPDAAPAKVHAHVAECDRCRKELDELKATMDLLDTWQPPEPSPYFLTRLDARMREERQAPPLGFFARLRDSFRYGPRHHLRPIAAMALSIMLLIGGGTYLGLNGTDKAKPPAQEAVVSDLQTIDNNAQLLDQLESLSSAPENGD